MSIDETGGRSDEVRLDLSDTEAVVLCLSCGGRYARELPRCATCGGTCLVARGLLARALRRTAPGLSQRELDRLCLVRLFVVEEPELLEAIRRGMTRAGFPHVVVSGDGSLLENGPIEGSATLFAGEDDEPAIREAAASWLPAGAEDEPGEPPPPLTLSALRDPQPIAVAHGEFETSLIRGELEREGIRYASAPDRRGLRFFVEPEDLDRANELLDRLDGSAPPDQVIPGEELERDALADGSIDGVEDRPPGQREWNDATGSLSPPLLPAHRSGRNVRRVAAAAVALGCAALALASPGWGAQSIIAWLGAAIAALVLALDLMNPGPG